jgi:hypothetical protein
VTPQSLLNENNITLESYAPGRHYTTCPRCSATRSKANQRRKVLGVTIEAGDGMRWGCNHCGWTGPGSGGNGGDDGLITYDYQDASGAVTFQKVRAYKNGKKTFWVRRPDGRGGWINNAENVDTKVLYRLPELIEAIGQGLLIAIVEGEKDADNLWRIGIPATCNAGGAAKPDQKPKWYAAHSEQLRGADVVVLNDNDPQGYAHAEATCKLSLGIAESVRRLDLKQSWPDIPEKADVSDWLACGHTREELDALIAQAPDYGTADAAAQQSQTMEALKTMTFAPIKYVVPGVIVEGLTILAGKPKIGKSWLMLHAAIAVACGGFTLGNIHCIEGDVLYCALEDNQRRLQSRMTKLLGIVPDWPQRMHYLCLGQLPRLNAGGSDKLKAWINSVANPRLIVIDTFVTVRAPKKNNQPNFDADYDSGKELQKLANEHGIAVVIVHHLRKADADDAFDTVNATLGLTAVVDTVLVLKRDASGGFVLYGRGRDLSEIEKGMVFNADACTWHIAGDAADIRRTKERTTVLQAIEEAEGKPVGPNEIAAATGMKAGNIRRLLGKLVKQGVIEKASYGKYRTRSAASGATQAPPDPASLSALAAVVAAWKAAIGIGQQRSLDDVIELAAGASNCGLNAALLAVAAMADSKTISNVSLAHWLRKHNEVPVDDLMLSGGGETGSPWWTLVAAEGAPQAA